MPVLKPKYVLCLKQGLTELIDRTSELIQAHGPLPMRGSQAEKEHNSFPERAQTIVSACAISNLLLEYSGEHLSVFVKILKDEIEPLASGKCIRSMLEACSIVIWLMDNRIDANRRVARVFAYRFNGAVQREKWGRAMSLTDEQQRQLSNQTATIQNDALNANCARVVTNRRVEIDQSVPCATDLIKTTLGEEPMYRALSSLAHGHNWAIQQLGFQNTPSHATTWNRTDVFALEKHIDADKLAVVGICGATAFAKALWHYGNYMGWETSAVTVKLDGVWDTLQLNESTRFWR